MNVLFMTLCNVHDINERGIYSDLLREFIKNGHHVCIVTPSTQKGIQVVNQDNCKIVKIFTGSIQKTNIVKKGMNTVLLETRFINAIKAKLNDVKFDLILFPTPPITLAGAVEYVKKRDNARTYLMLKDIFPQNAVDIGMMTKTGFKGLIYKYFRFKEKKLYALSDVIGCMSQANIEYLLKHNSYISPSKVELCPNSCEPIDLSVSSNKKWEMREKFGIPKDKTVFVYGGNLGKPQGITFLIKCLESQKDNSRVFFLIVGDGTEYGEIERYLHFSGQENVKLMKRLPKVDYDNMVGACDVGLIFLDHRFTIPNFPSRLLSYMQAKLPILAVTDPNTDIGKVIVDGGFGWWCESNDTESFTKMVNDALNTDIKRLKDNETKYLYDNYDVDIVYSTIMRHVYFKDGENK